MVQSGSSFWAGVQRCCRRYPRRQYAKAHLPATIRPINDRAHSQGLHNIVPIQCDVTNQEQLQSAAKCIQDDVGYINLLVANSGVSGPSGNVPKGASIAELQETLFKIPIADFTNTYHVNCSAVFYTVVAFLGLLEKGNSLSSYQGGRSQVIATSSIGSFNRRITSGFAYGTSKAATTMLMKVLATYLAPYRIRCNVLCPGCKFSEHEGLSSELCSGKMGVLS